MAEKLTKAQLAEIKDGRKKLKVRLKEQGIKGNVQFEQIARELGLSLPTSTGKGLIIGWWLKLAGLVQVAAASTTLLSLLGLGTIIMGGTFLAAYVTETKGNFTINVTADMIQQGYVLSDDASFEHTSTRLYTDEIENINAISVQDIESDINFSQDGSHNGTGYMAYTFYIRNEGDMESSYTYSLNITSETSGAIDATWVMVYVNDEQMIYSSLSEDGDRENLYGYSYMPFEEYATDSEALYYEDSGKYGIVPVEFIDDSIVMGGVIEDMQPGEYDKYTIVIWIEGDDPECTNDILGGHVGFNFQFEMINDDDELNLFKGLYMTEYQDAQEGYVESKEDTQDETEE